jgi:hypothetical protein
MTPPDLTHLADLLLAVAAAGATLVFAFLAGQRVPSVSRLKVIGSTVAIALPGVLLALMVSQPELGIRSAYGSFTDTVLSAGSPEPEVGPMSPPVAGGPSLQRISASAEVASSSPSPEPSQAGNLGGPNPPVAPTTTAPPTTAAPTATATPTPTASPTQSTAPPSPSGTTAQPTASDIDEFEDV